MTRLLLIASVLAACGCGNRTLVSGALSLVAKSSGHVGTESKPLMSYIGEFWCGIEKNGEDIPIVYGEFTRLRDGKIFEAEIKDNQAKLDIGRAPATVAGKYLCEVRSASGDVVTGDLVVYSPPFLRLPAGSIFYEVLDARPPKVLGGVTRASEGDRVELHCPVFGYPQPYTRWEKDGEPLDRSLPIEYDGDTLILMSVDDTMSGIYTCIADNSFPLFDDGPSLPHELHYFQKFVVDR